MTRFDPLTLIEKGLPPTGHPRKVVVVGAGMAGLVAAYELKRAGHRPVLLEARPRVGGRIYTLREPFTHGLYAEAGAMRIPRAHCLTMAYIQKFGLKTRDFNDGQPQRLGVCRQSETAPGRGQRPPPSARFRRGVPRARPDRGFALFDPGQQTLLHDLIVALEGRIHFAEEHTSLCHAWIQGAIESGMHAMSFYNPFANGCAPVPVFAQPSGCGCRGERRACPERSVGKAPPGLREDGFSGSGRPRHDRSRLLPTISIHNGGWP
jgi:hypothetical protein